nr:hypothetical protein BaRGS_030160 [Batillaria attramentaria]
MPGADSHDIVSTLSLDGMKPLTVSGQANLDMDDLQLGSFVKYGKIALDGLVNSKSSKSGSSHNARVRLFTPFDKLENIVVSVGLDSSNTQHEISTKMVFGGKKDVLTSSLVFTTAIGKDKCEASLTAENRGTSSSRDLQGALTVKSTWRTIRDMTITAAHKDDGRNFANNVNVNLNDQKYAYVMSMDHSDNTNKGEMTVSWPRDQLKAVWDHRMSANVISSSTSCTWGRDKRVQFDVTGRHLLGNMRTVTGNMALQTPWTRDWSAEVKHEHGMGKVISTSSLKFSWEPSSKVTADGSVIVNNWDDLDISVRVTTPVRGMRSLAAQITSKSEGSEVVSHATFDYGVRDSFDLETRVQRDLTSARAKVKTSFEAVRVIEGGILVQPDLEDFSLRADFKAMPVLGKYESALTWTTGDDFNARFRLDTPHTEFPYLQIYSLDSTYSFEAPLLVDITARTPIAGYDSLGATFKHFATDYSIKTSAERGGSSVTGTLKFVNKAKTDAQLSLSTPLIEASVSRKGDMDNMRGMAILKVGEQKMQANLNHKWKRPQTAHRGQRQHALHRGNEPETGAHWRPQQLSDPRAT